MPQNSPPVPARLLALAESLGVDVCTVYSYKEALRVLRLEASYGLDNAVVGYTIPVDQGLVGRVARTGLPFSTRNPANHPDYHFVPGSGEEKYASFLGMPIKYFDTLLGVLAVQTVSPRAFRIAEIESIYRMGKGVVLEVLDRDS